MTLFDRLVLLVTGLVAIYLVVHFYRKYRQGNSKTNYNLYYLAAFAVLLVAGLLLIALGYDILANPLVVIVSSFIPALLATGLVTQFYPKSERAYLIYAILGVLGIAFTRLGGEPGGLATFILATVHSIFGLTIFFIPIIATRKGQVTSFFPWVTVGGTLISIGGIALAFLKAGMPILSQELILTILAPLLLLMAISYALGFVKGNSASPHNPKEAKV